MADEAEYEDGSFEPRVRDSSSTGSKDSTNARPSRVGFDVFGGVDCKDELKVGLIGIGGDVRTTLLRAASEDDAGAGAGKPDGIFAGIGDDVEGPSLVAFFQGVDVPHSAQKRRMFPLTA